MIQSFRDLTVWQKGMDLAERIYLSTEQFPRSEMYGLTKILDKPEADELLSKASEVGRMIAGLLKALPRD